MNFKLNFKYNKDTKIIAPSTAKAKISSFEFNLPKKNI